MRSGKQLINYSGSDSWAVSQMNKIEIEVGILGAHEFFVSGIIWWLCDEGRSKYFLGG